MVLEIQEQSQTQKKPKRMLEIKQLENGKRLVEINFSSLSIIQECKRKANYSLIQKLRSEDESEALTFGKAIHKALEHWYCLPEVNRQLTDKELAMVDAVASGGLIPEGEYPTALDSIFEFVKAAEAIRWLDDSDKRSLSNGIKILKAYFKHYADDGMEVLRDSSGQAMVEKECEYVLHEDENTVILFHGQIDLILRNKLTGQILVADHKTTAALGKDFYNRIRPNHQYTGYVYAARNVLGLDTSSFLVNGIQVAKTKSEFARQVTDRYDEDFAEMKEAYVSAVKDLLTCVDSGVFPMTAPNPCSAYGGCPYLDACQAPAKLRQNIIESKYNKS